MKHIASHILKAQVVYDLPVKEQVAMVNKSVTPSKPYLQPTNAFSRFNWLIAGYY